MFTCVLTPERAAHLARLTFKDGHHGLAQVIELLFPELAACCEQATHESDTYEISPDAHIVVKDGAFIERGATLATRPGIFPISTRTSGRVQVRDHLITIRASTPPLPHKPSTVMIGEMRTSEGHRAFRQNCLAFASDAIRIELRRQFGALFFLLPDGAVTALNPQDSSTEWLTSFLTSRFVESGLARRNPPTLKDISCCTNEVYDFLDDLVSEVNGRRCIKEAVATIPFTIDALPLEEQWNLIEAMAVSPYRSILERYFRVQFAFRLPNTIGVRRLASPPGALYEHFCTPGSQLRVLTEMADDIVATHTPLAATA